MHASKIVMSAKCSRDMDVIGYYYVVEQFPYIFSCIPYSLPFALICQFFELLGALFWTYIDLFIIVMSIALALRFKQIMSKLQHFGYVKVTIISSF